MRPSRLGLFDRRGGAGRLDSVLPGADVGVVPVDAEGRPLNLGFEAGTLKDWHAEGDAFAGMPVEGDAVAKRRGDMKSGHAGRFWVGVVRARRATRRGGP